MSYRGNTYQIPCAKGGVNASVNKASIPPESMVIGSKNLDLSDGTRSKRGGTSKVNGTAVSGTPQIMGIFDYLKPAGSQYIVFATNDGKIWKNSTATIKTGLTVSKFTNFSQFNSLLIACNGADVPQSWNGSDASTTALANIPTDWAGTNQPTQMLLHGKGVSERLWAIGCASNVYTIYASAQNAGDGTTAPNFADANVTTLNVDTGDGYGIVGIGEFQDNLFCFGRRKTYIIDDADTTVANWGYSAAPWEGGAAHHRLIVKTPTDLVCMTEDGEIYSVGAAMQYGDYEKASLTEGTYLHEWIKANLRLSYINSFHAVYDPVLRAIKFFVVRNGQTTVDTCLVFFVDRTVQEAWMIHDNLNYASGYNASCAGLIRVGAGDYQIYTGDYSGFIWKLEQSTENDADNAYWSGFKTPILELTDGRTNKRFDRGWLILEPQGTETLTIDWWVDGTLQTSKTVVAEAGVRRYSFDLGQVGNDIELQVYNNTANEDFAISQVYIDFKVLGAKPAGVTAATSVGMGAG